MFYQPQQTKEEIGLPFNPIKALVVPRPIGWISSLSPEGVANLAPFSYFQMLIDDPPTLMFSAVGPHVEGDEKDTPYNVMRTGEFVYNMATWELREQVNLSSAALERNVDEFDYAGLTKAPSNLVKVPRVAESPVSMECRLREVIHLPSRRLHVQARLVIGEVVGIHIADEVIHEGRVDIKKLKPIARLGYQDYAVIEETFEMPRPGK
jgi:flavin reductase (DIM6/NTAB) family NADH-FMN oxidoreductase RutF